MDGLLRQLQPQDRDLGTVVQRSSSTRLGGYCRSERLRRCCARPTDGVGLEDDPDSQYLAMDVDRLASDCRWAAGRVEEAIAFLHAAKDRYEEVVDGRLEQPARLSPALLDRLAEPLFSLYQDMADRLAAIGEVDLRLMTRRRLIELLRGLTGRLGDPARLHLASALTDLAHDLLEYGRVDEADAAAAEAAAIEQSLEVRGKAIEDPARGTVGGGGQSVTWTPLPPTASYAATTASAAGRVDLTILQAERQRKAAAWLQAERARRTGWSWSGWSRRESRRSGSRPNGSKLNAPPLLSWLPSVLGTKRPSGSRQSEGPRPRRRSGWSGSAGARNASRRTGWRSSDGKPSSVRRSGSRPREQAGEQLAADPAEAERLELERLQAEIDELEPTRGAPPPGPGPTPPTLFFPPPPPPPMPDEEMDEGANSSRSEHGGTPAPRLRTARNGGAVVSAPGYHGLAGAQLAARRRFWTTP